MQRKTAYSEKKYLITTHHKGRLPKQQAPLTETAINRYKKGCIVQPLGLFNQIFWNVGPQLCPNHATFFTVLSHRHYHFIVFTGLGIIF